MYRQFEDYHSAICIHFLAVVTLKSASWLQNHSFLWFDVDVSAVASSCIFSMLVRAPLYFWNYDSKLLHRLTTQFFCGQILRCINQLSVEPNTLEPLQRADAIKHLVPFLEQQEGLYVDMIQNEVNVSFSRVCTGILFCSLRRWWLEEPISRQVHGYLSSFLCCDLKEPCSQWLLIIYTSNISLCARYWALYTTCVRSTNVVKSKLQRVALFLIWCASYWPILLSSSMPYPYYVIWLMRHDIPGNPW